MNVWREWVEGRTGRGVRCVELSQRGLVCLLQLRPIEPVHNANRLAVRCPDKDQRLAALPVRCLCRVGDCSEAADAADLCVDGARDLERQRPLRCCAVRPHVDLPADGEVQLAIGLRHAERADRELLPSTRVLGVLVPEDRLLLLVPRAGDDAAVAAEEEDLSKVPSKVAKFYLQIVESRLEFRSKILPERCS